MDVQDLVVETRLRLSITLEAALAALATLELVVPTVEGLLTLLDVDALLLADAIAVNMVYDFNQKLKCVLVKKTF